MERNSSLVQLTGLPTCTECIPSDLCSGTMAVMSSRQEMKSPGQRPLDTVTERRNRSYKSRIAESSPQPQPETTLSGFVHVYFGSIPKTKVWARCVDPWCHCSAWNPLQWGLWTLSPERRRGRMAVWLRRDLQWSSLSRMYYGGKFLMGYNFFMLKHLKINEAASKRNFEISSFTRAHHFSIKNALATRHLSPVH